MGALFVPAYWLLFRSREEKIYRFVEPGGGAIISRFSYDPADDSMVWRNTSGGNWINSWFYRYVPGFGIAEWRDDYPNGKRVVFETPIGWGEWAEIGKKYQNCPRTDPLRCRPFADYSGDQLVVFEAHMDEMKLSKLTFRDVLQIGVIQKFGSKVEWSRYWLAKEVGPIAFELAQGAPRFELRHVKDVGAIA